MCDMILTYLGTLKILSTWTLSSLMGVELLPEYGARAVVSTWTNCNVTCDCEGKPSQIV